MNTGTTVLVGVGFVVVAWRVVVTLLLRRRLAARRRAREREQAAAEELAFLTLSLAQEAAEVAGSERQRRAGRYQPPGDGPVVFIRRRPARPGSLDRNARQG